MPYGIERENPSITLTNYKFTDQEKDTETGLYNYDARMYDPVIALFISPDPVVPDVAGTGLKYLYDPQMLNRYAYVRNNPLNATDPTGFEVLNEEQAASLSGTTKTELSGYGTNTWLDKAVQGAVVDAHGLINESYQGQRADIVSKYGLMILTARAFKGPGTTKAPKSGTLSNAKARAWYDARVKNINTDLKPTKANAELVHSQRNALKQQSRDLMADRSAAARLDKNYPLRDYNHYADKYSKQGYPGESLQKRIMQGGKTPNKSVSRKYDIDN